MKPVKPIEVTEAAEAANAEKPKPALTLEILIERMMQTHRDIQAYDRGEMTLEELHALGVKLG